MRQIERRPPAPAPRPAARLRLERRILHTLRERALTPPGSRGLVCVSGGPDSLALLHLLHAAAGPLALRLDVLHFDHGLRPEAATEADWVARQAAAFGLPCHILRATHLAQRATGVQAAARAWRRAEALRLATQWDAQWVASGHQRDDQLETILLKLLRGAHISRLAGMDWRQGRFVRPLLDTSRAELTDYLRRRGQEWLEDPSNRRPAYKRNRVRHELLTLLDALAGGAAAQRLTALETQSAQVAELLRFVQAAHPVPQSPPEVRTHWIDAAALAALPHAVAGATLHAFVVARLPGTLPASQLEQALHLLAVGAPQWSLDLSQRRRLRRRGARLLLECQPEARTGAAGEGAWHVVDGRRIQAPAGWRVSPATPSGDAPDGETTLALHNLPPGAELQVRAPQPGDRFQPAWKARPVLLARFLRDQHVAPWERERVTLVLWEGRVIAVGTGHVADAHAAPASPEAALRLTIRPV